MTPEPQNAENGKVTMAVLGTKLDAPLHNQVRLEEQLARLSEYVERDHDRLIAHAGLLEEGQRRIAALESQASARIIETLLAIATALGFVTTS